MLTASSYNQLKNAQIAIEKLNVTKPSIHINVYKYH